MEDVLEFAGLILLASIVIVLLLKYQPKEG